MSKQIYLKYFVFEKLILIRNFLKTIFLMKNVRIDIRGIWDVAKLGHWECMNRQPLPYNKTWTCI
jgi:hypothetical protein